MKSKTVLVFLAMTVFLAQTGFAPELAKFVVLEGNSTQIEVQFNPKELTIDKSVPWTKTKTSTEDQPELEFTDAEPKTLSVELMFDTFESQEDVARKYSDRLFQLATVDPKLKRPPRVRFSWGTLPEFEGVIESVSVKYTMFSPNGIPVRATCNVKMKEASRASFKKGS